MARPRPGITDQELIDLVPPQHVLKPAIRFYLKTFETSYRILHVPSFRKEVELFQASINCRADFAAILLLIVATTACCLNQAEMKYASEESVARQEAAQYIFACEGWINQHSRKHMTLAFFQIHCLLLVAKRVNSFKVKQTWNAAEGLVSLAAAAGLHRDPSLLSERITPFQQEMKRRLWATIVELDVLCSLERGMPASATALLCDTTSPRNIDDEDFDETTTEIPTSVPLTSRLTGITFLCTSYNSLPLRLRLTNILNSPKLCLSKSEILQFTDELTKAIQEVQNLPWVEQHSNSDHSDVSISQTILEAQLYRYLMALHRSSLDDSSDLSLHNLSQGIRQNAGVRIIELHQSLWRGGDASLILFSGDVFDAIVNICYDISRNNNNTNNTTTGDRKMITQFFFDFNID